MVWFIVLFTLLSYVSAVRSILSNEYRPSIYSRVIWFFIAFNNFASVVVLRNSPGVRAMAALALVGNVAMLALALKKSKKTFGITEVLSSALLIMSLIIWLTTKLPILNLTIGLIAHFIGGIPTFKQVIKKPRDEYIYFWFWFFLAGLLALTTANWSHPSSYLYALYVVIFDGLVLGLCLRRYLGIEKVKI